MRKIKFKGKRIDNGQWIYGFLLKNGVNTYIAYYDSAEQYRPHKELVILETVSQYTGLKDKNGVEIYEGDIIKSSYYKDEKLDREFIHYVLYVLGSFILSTKGSNMGFGLGYEATKSMNPRLEVVGNIHDKIKGA